MKPEAYRRQINKTLRKLNETYNLITVEFHFGKNAEVKSLDIKNKTKPYEYPKENYYLLPKKYYGYQWNIRLSLRAKYCYLINLYISQEGNGKTWSLSREDISEKFGLISGTISDGMNELRSIINLILEYPDRIVKDAYKYVGKKAKDNPKRNQNYAVAIMKDQGNRK
jgi:hypothetical protein